MTHAWPSLKIPLLALAACLLWSTAFVGVKIGLRYCGPFAFAGIRFMLAGLLLVPFWWRVRRPFGTLATNAGMILKVCVFQTFLLYGLFYWGMTLVPGALAAIVVGASPLTSAVVAHFAMSGDRLTGSKLVSIALGMVGIAVIALSRQPWSQAGFREFVGVLILFSGTMASAIGNVLVARDPNHVPPVLLNSVQIFFGGLLLLLVSLPLEGTPDFNWPMMFWVSLIYLAALSAVAFSIWFYLLQQPGARVSDLNLWKFVIPVSGAALSWLVLPDEAPTAAAMVGMVCVAAAILIYHGIAASTGRDHQIFHGPGSYR